MRDVAAKAGVHQTTVSLAFRNHPSIPVATRERIRAIAAEIGYRPDPLIDAFNHYRLAQQPTDAPVIAVVIDGLDRSFRDKVSAHPDLLKGIRDAAAERGYKIETFEVSPRKLTAARIGQILTARGIQGVIVSAFSLQTSALALEWDHFSCVRVGSTHLAPALDTLTVDHWAGTRLALRRLRELGYRRVGLVAGETEERRLDDRFRLGVLVEQSTIPPSSRVAPLIFSEREEANLGQRVVQWMREQRVDAVMTNHALLWDELTTAGIAIPEHVAFASLDLSENETKIAGIVQNHALVGRRALEQLSMLLHTHQRGAPSAQTITFVPCYWRDGPSAPARLKLY